MSEQKFIFDSGRLKEPASESIRAFTKGNLNLDMMQEELDFGVQIDKAHVLMLAEQGVIEVNDAGLILGQLNLLQSQSAEEFIIDPKKGGTYAQIEGSLIQALGSKVGGQLHIGRSRIDRRATISRLAARRVLLNLTQKVIGFQKVLLERAAETTDAIMPGYTHMQHAQPITFAHYLSSYVDRLQRDTQRLMDAYNRLNHSPLGVAALAGTSWPLNRNRTAELLGFDNTVRNARDGGEFYKDFNLEIISHLAILATTLSHFANELYIWHSYEFGFIELSDAYTANSSMMPQKKNPHALDIIKSMSGFVVGMPATEFSMHRMCTSSDLEATFSRSGIHEANKKLATALDIFSGAIASVTLNKPRMREQAGAHWATMVNLADELSQHANLSFRESHQVCGRFVQLALEKGVTPQTVTGGLLDEAADAILGYTLSLSDEFVQQALDVDHFVQTRTTAGGTAPSETMKILTLQQSDYQTMLEWQAQQENSIDTANQMLNDAMKKYR